MVTDKQTLKARDLSTRKKANVFSSGYGLIRELMKEDNQSSMENVHVRFKTMKVKKKFDQNLVYFSFEFISVIYL